MTTIEQSLAYLQANAPVHIDVFDRTFPGEGFDLRVQMVGNALAVQDEAGYLHPTTPLPGTTPAPTPGATAFAKEFGAFMEAELSKIGVGLSLSSDEHLATLAKSVDLHTRAPEMMDFVKSVSVQPLPEEIPSWYREVDWEKRYAEIVRLAREVVRILPIPQPTDADKT